MTDDERGSAQLSRRKVLGSMAVIGAAGAGAAGTWAAWEDDAVSENTVQAGTMELDINGNPESSTTLAATGVVPGESDSTTATLENVGDVDGDLSLEITDVSVDSSGSTLAEDLNIQITWAGNNFDQPASGAQGETRDGPSLDAGQTRNVDIGYALDSDPADGGQGGTVEFEVTFTLVQV